MTTPTIPIRVFFAGTPALAVPSLRALHLDPRFEIIGVATPPDKPVGRKQQLTPTAVKTHAIENNIPVYEISNKKELNAIIKTLSFDLGVVIAFGVIFPQSVLDRPPLGWVNVHFSLLPLWRGASPVQSAILSGMPTSGVSFQRMVAQLDAGDIISQHELPLNDATTGQLWADWGDFTATTLPDDLALYAVGDLPPTEQNHSVATHCGKFTKADGLIDPASMTATEISLRARAFTPWPGVYVETLKGTIKITRADALHPPTGTLLCADETDMPVHRAQKSGKKPLAISELLRGNPELSQYLSEVAEAETQPETETSKSS